MYPLHVQSERWRVVSVDMITQLPNSASGHKCIVVFVDQFNKMERLIPTVLTLDGPGSAALFSSTSTHMMVCRLEFVVTEVEQQNFHIPV